MGVTTGPAVSASRAEGISPLRLTPSVRKVLEVLAARPGVKLDVRAIARQTSLSPGTVMKTLTMLCRARLVQFMEQRGIPDRPPHRVFWTNQAGRDVALAQAAAHQRRYEESRRR